VLLQQLPRQLALQYLPNYGAQVGGLEKALHQRLPQQNVSHLHAQQQQVVACLLTRRELEMGHVPGCPVPRRIWNR